MKTQGIIKTFCAAFLFVVVALLYSPALEYDYVWDDSILFLDNTALVNEPLSWPLLAKPVLEGSSYLRPLVFLSWFFEFKVFEGAVPKVSHVINIALHAINTVLLFLLACFLYRRQFSQGAIWGALFSALLYGCHPALVEATTWVSGRFDLLCTTFILLSCLSYLYFYEKKFLVASLVSVFFLLSLFSKELGVVIPGLIVCLWFAFRGGERKVLSPVTLKVFMQENKVLLAMLVCAFLVYLVIRAASPGGVYHVPFSASYFFSTVLLDQVPFVALRMYALGSLLPFSSIDPVHPVSSQMGGLWGAGLNVVTLLSVVGFLRFGRRLGNTAYWFVVAWFLCLLPVLHFIPLSLPGSIIHQRFLTAPIAFFSVAAGLYFWKLFNQVASLSKRKVIVFFACMYLCLCLLIVRSVLPIWKNDATLWGWTYQKYPESEISFFNYSYGLMKLMAYDQALSVMEEKKAEDGALTPQAQIMYSMLLMSQGDKEALPYIQGVVDVLPKYHDEYASPQSSPLFVLTSSHLSAAYSAMSTAQLIFNGDLDSALKYNGIAQWYLEDSRKKPVWYQQLALSFLNKNKGEVEELVRKIRKWNFYSATLEKDNAKNMVLLYCEKELGDCEVLIREFSEVISRINVGGEVSAL